MSWWNNNYIFRRGLQLAIIDPIPSNHPVTVNFDTTKLLGLNKVIYPYLDDIVIVYYDSNDDTWTPLPTEASFVGEQINIILPTQTVTVGNSIQIQFNTYLPIIENTNDYYVYYGNKNLTEAPDLAPLSLNIWPLKISYISNKITYKHPGEDWVNGLTTLTGAKAAFVFSGTAVRLIAEAGIADGIAALQLDNELSVNTDFYRNGPTQFTDVYSRQNLIPEYHTIRVINTGQRNPSATNTRIAINSFEYLGYILATDLGEEINTLNWSTNTGGTT